MTRQRGSRRGERPAEQAPPQRPFGGGQPFGGPPFMDPFAFGGMSAGSLPLQALAAIFSGRQQRARRGHVRAAILSLLGKKPCNGYQIIQELEQRSQGRWRPSPGSIYPTLQQLEDEGLVHGEAAAGGGRTFSLTAKGKRAAEELVDEEPADEPASDDPRAPLLEAMMNIRQLVIAVMQVAQVGTPAQLAEAKKTLNDARRTLYRILSEEHEEADDE